MGGDPGADPEFAGRITHLAWEHLRIPQEDLGRDVWNTLLFDKRKNMDLCMDG